MYSNKTLIWVTSGIFKLKLSDKQECCSQRCLDQFSKVDIDSMQKKISTLNQKQRRQYLLDCFSVSFKKGNQLEQCKVYSYRKLMMALIKFRFNM